MTFQRSPDILPQLHYFCTHSKTYLTIISSEDFGNRNQYVKHILLYGITGEIHKRTKVAKFLFGGSLVRKGGLPA